MTDLTTLNRLLYLPTTFFLPEDISARDLMTFPRVLSDWLMAEPSFSLSPVAPVESALSLKYCKEIKYIKGSVLSYHLNSE